MNKTLRHILFCAILISFSLPVCAQYAQNENWNYWPMSLKVFGREMTYIIDDYMEDYSADVIKMEIEKTMSNYGKAGGSCRIGKVLTKRCSDGSLLLEINHVEQDIVTDYYPADHPSVNIKK